MAEQRSRMDRLHDAVRDISRGLLTDRYRDNYLTAQQIEIELVEEYPDLTSERTAQEIGMILTQSDFAEEWSERNYRIDVEKL